MLHRWVCCPCLLCRNDLVWWIYITMGLLYKRLKAFHSIQIVRFLTRFCSGPGSAFPLRIILDILNLFSVSLENSHQWLVLCSAKNLSQLYRGLPLVEDQDKNNLLEILFDEGIHGRAALVGWFFILVLKMGIATLFAFAIGGVCVPGAGLEERKKGQGEVND